MQGFWPIFGVGCGGALLAELARWYSLREAPTLPEYAKKLHYWLITALMIAAGGGLAIAYGFEKAQSVLLVINIGASAPLIIKALASATPPDVPHMGVTDDTKEGLWFKVPKPVRRSVDFVAGR